MHCTRKPSMKRGFTLIELLVVIAIIAILAAILFPVFAQARSKARQAVGLSNAKQESLAILMYVQDYDESMPRTGWTCLQLAGMVENSCGATDWLNVTAPYTKNAGILTSPGDASKSNGAGNAYDGNVSLLMNDLLAHTVGTDAAGHSDYNNHQTQFASGLSLAAINSPADCTLLAEGHCNWFKIDQQGYINSPESHGPDVSGKIQVSPATSANTNRYHSEQTISGGVTFMLAGKAYPGGEWGQYTTGAPFYNGGGVVAFTDGHAKYIRMADQSGNPTLCSTLGFWQHEDPGQVGVNGATDSCSNAGGDGPGTASANWD
jgi:prepilin-type N-terminal cleavage/methylation domain-containing protein